MIKIKLGSGNDTNNDRIDVDCRSLDGVDVVTDLDKHPWPFDNNYADLIIARAIFEHLDDVVGALEECHRILKSSGRLRIRGPREGGGNVWGDVTHKRGFNAHSFDHFDPSTRRGRQYDYGKGKWKILSKQNVGANIEFVMRPIGKGPSE